ncbi:MAG: DUF58 domain-containing protein [Pseudomonadales bacterium]
MKRFGLTGRGFTLVVVLTLGLIISLWGDGNLELLWRALAMLSCVALVLEWLAQQRTRISAHLKHESEPTDDVAIETRLGKRTHLTIEIETDNQRQFRAYLPGNEAFEVYRQKLVNNLLHCEVMPHQLGSHSPGQLFVRTKGLFSLSTWDHGVAIAESIIVKADHSLATMNLNSQSFKQRYADKISGNGFELDRLRDYQQGDSVRFMDWKATARRRKKTVRQFTDENQQEVCILLDASHYGRVEVDGISRFTHMLNTTARLSSLANRSGDQVSFCAYGATTKALIPPGNSHHHHQKVLQSLAEATIDEGPANHLMGYMHASRFLKRRSLLVFITHLDHASATDHLAQTIALASRKHLVVTASIRDYDLDKLIATDAIRWRDPFHALAATQIKDATEILIGKLQRQGAYVLHAHPDTVDRDLVSTYQRIRERRLVS